MTAPTSTTHPRLLNFLAIDALWWFAYIVFCYVVGWDFGQQIRGPLFWIVAIALEAWTIVRWRRTTSVQLQARVTRHQHGHQTAIPEASNSRVRRALIGFVGLAATGLVATTFLVDTAIADGRTLLLGDEFLESDYQGWSESFAALDTELWGLAIYDYALVVGLGVIVVEVIALLARRRRPEQPSRRLWLLDSLASVSTQVPFYLIEIFTVTAMIGSYFFIWDNLTVAQLPIQWSTIGLGVLAADFAYYWEHRAGHTIRLLWTGHAVHHSSPVFNTAVAFRFGPFEPVLAVLFHLPLIMLGFHPAIVILGELTVQAYQFWIHTEVIGKLGPLDRVLNTPSNHRVHHGSNDKYLDKNYGGILIVFDRLFGTYQAEEETPVYGLTQQINTVNPLKVWFSEFPALFADLRSSTTWHQWWGYLLREPGWTPGSESDMTRNRGERF